MAEEGGHPVASEPYRQGAPPPLSCDSTLPVTSPHDRSGRSSEPHRLEGPVHAHQGDPRGDSVTTTHFQDRTDSASTTLFTQPPPDRTDSASTTLFTQPPPDRTDSASTTLFTQPSSSLSHSTRETDVRGHQGAAAERSSGEQQRLHPLLPDPAPLRRPPQQQQPAHRPTQQPAQRPRSIAEAYPAPSPPRASAATPPHHMQDERLRPASCLPIQRCHSDSAPPLFAQPPPSHGDPRGPCGPALGEPRGPPLPAACQLQPMQQQQQQPLQQQQPCQMFASGACGPPPPRAPTQWRYGCCGSYAHTNFHLGGPEDTLAARCHAHGDQQGVASVGPLPDALGLPPPPRLMSSVSETGLDAKRVLHCCDRHDCSWGSSLPFGVVPRSLQQHQQQQHQGSGLNEVCIMGGVPATTSAPTRDVGTMTAQRRMVDSGVQTEHSPPPHVFPQVCLVEENGNVTDGNHNKMAESDSNGQKTPVKEVKWDAEGMTWEVYGASVDPEELGLAIQKHLELQIKETAVLAAKLCRQDTNTSRQSVPPADSSRRRKRSRMTMGSIRTPTCCARSSTAVD